MVATGQSIEGARTFIAYRLDVSNHDHSRKSDVPFLVQVIAPLTRIPRSLLDSLHKSFKLVKISHYMFIYDLHKAICVRSKVV